MTSAQIERRERFQQYQGRSQVIGELLVRLKHQIADARVDLPKNPQVPEEALEALAAYNVRLQEGITGLLDWLTDQQREISDELVLLAGQFRDELKE
jgi:hypothetical protein